MLRGETVAAAPMWRPREPSLLLTPTERACLFAVVPCDAVGAAGVGCLAGWLAGWSRVCFQQTADRLPRLFCENFRAARTIHSQDNPSHHPNHVCDPLIRTSRACRMCLCGGHPVPCPSLLSTVRLFASIPIASLLGCVRLFPFTRYLVLLSFFPHCHFLFPFRH